MAERLNKENLLESLKKRWKKQNDNDEALWIENYPYYFKDLESNLIDGMSKTVRGFYNNGSGSELKWRKKNGKDYPPKMHALHSSSAMTFNIFGSNIVEICENNSLGVTAVKYKIEYEKKFPTGVNSAKANIDAYLVSESGNEIVLFEMKMTEWLLGQPKKLRKTYLNADDEYGELKKLAEKFVDTNITYKENGKEVHPATTHYFDVVQVILHIWGLYNTIRVNKTKFARVKKITLICGTWTIENKEYEQFEKYKKIEKDADCEFQRFKTSKELENVIKIFDKENICLEIKKIPVKKIIECLEKTDAEKKYLKRYL